MDETKPSPLPGAYYLWWYTDERTGKRRKTRWRMTPEEAATNTDLQGPLEPDLSSAEVRHKIGGASDIGKKSAPSE
jgi:hypothetical protein